MNLYEVRMSLSSTDNYPWAYKHIKAETPEDAAKIYIEQYANDPYYDNVEWNFDVEVKNHRIYNVSNRVTYETIVR